MDIHSMLSSDPEEPTNGSNSFAIQPDQNPQMRGVKSISRESKQGAITSDICKIPCLFEFAGCEASFGRLNELRRHIATIHIPEFVYNCRECDKIFPRKDGFRNHYRQSHQLEKAKLSFEKIAEDAKVDVKSIHDEESPIEIDCFIAGCQMKFTGSGRLQGCVDHAIDHLTSSLREKVTPCKVKLSPTVRDYLVKLKTLKESGSSIVLGELSTRDSVHPNKEHLRRASQPS